MAAPLETPEAHSPGRHHGIDLLKALATLTVVAIHASRPMTMDRHPIELGLARLFLFAVPAFLFCSGFLLHLRGPVPPELTRRRLARLLLPYLVASVLALLYQGFVRGQPLHPLRDLLLGNAFGPYYYVFIVVSLIAFIPLLARLTDSARALLCAFFVVLGARLGGTLPDSAIYPWLHLLVPPTIVVLCWRTPGSRVPALLTCAVLWAIAAGTLALTAYPIAWLDGVPTHMRNPGFHWGYFLLGWELRARAGRDGRIGQPFAIAALCLALGLGVWGFRIPPGPESFPTFLYSICVIVGILSITGARPGPGAGRIRLLSDASYTVYLFHLFAVIPLAHLWPLPDPSPATLAIAATHWAAGLALPLALVWFATRFPPLGPFVGLREPARASSEP